jgi:hypothetical protein
MGITNMDEKLVAVEMGIAAGAVGYWINTFWMRPLIRYGELRSKVYSDLIFYAQVVSDLGLNDRMREMYESRVMENRRSSADLAACLLDLPLWYRAWLRLCGQAPEIAVTQLIGYSNTIDWDHAEKRQVAIKKALGFKI